ncbi:hypothetical protein D1872_284630 [compost metagenome]
MLAVQPTSALLHAEAQRMREPLSLRLHSFHHPGTALQVRRNPCEAGYDRYVRDAQLHPSVPDSQLARTIHSAQYHIE